MSQYTVDEIVEKYITLRNIKREMVHDHEESLKPVEEKLQKLEAWLLGTMNQMGVDSFKTPSGTAFKKNVASCKIADGDMFRQFVFQPIVDWLNNSVGVAVDAAQLMTLPKWNLVDFRSLKKGVEEYIEDNSQIPPGLDVVQTTTVNVRSK